MNDVGDYLREYSNEVAILTRTYFTWKVINVSASQDKQALAALNKASSTWSVVLHSLQTTMFISLGRVFDIDAEAFSIHKFVKYCSENVEEFNRAALRKRKMAGLEKAPPWLEGYLNMAHYPKREELLRLRGEVAKYCKIYDENYKPIRHKLMAHKEFSAIGTTDALFAITNISEIEDIISFCNRIKHSIQQQYENGKKIVISDKAFFDLDDIVAEEEIKKLFNALKTA